MARLLFFGALADRFGRERTVNLSHQSQTVADLIAQLKSDAPEDAARLADASVKVSVNARIAPRDTAISDADEIGFMPPFSGG
jgi:molybdopterin converting factor small subunit